MPTGWITGWWWTQGNDTREALGGPWSFEVGYLQSSPITPTTSHWKHAHSAWWQQQMAQRHPLQMPSTSMSCWHNCLSEDGITTPPWGDSGGNGMTPRRPGRRDRDIEEGSNACTPHLWAAPHRLVHWMQREWSWWHGEHGTHHHDVYDRGGDQGPYPPHKCQLHLPYHTISLAKVGGSFIFLGTCCNHIQGQLLFSTHVACFNCIFFWLKVYSTVINTNITMYNVSCKLV